MNVLDKGIVNLLNFMGGDVSVVMSARVSNGKIADYSNPTEPDKDKKLINYLMKHRHGTPFEHSIFTFYVKCPIFVAREWMRHRIGSYNEISGRYVEFEPEFYLPREWRVPAATNKQGSMVPDDKSINWHHWHTMRTFDAMIAYEKAYIAYDGMLKMGVAKEMARMVLPVSLYTQLYWTVNARSLMNFLNLRLGEDAQWEIRQYALSIKDMFRESMPMTHDAWEENNHVAP